VVAVGGIGFAVGDGLDDSPVAAPAPETVAHPPGTRTVAGRGVVGSVTGNAVLVPKAWGTSIELTVAGTQHAVGPGVQCRLVVVSTTGVRDSVGTWVVPTTSPTKTGEHLTVPTSVRLNELAQLLVVTEDGDEVLVVKA
jgi:hypothetical protein